MDIRQINYFKYTCECRSISAAARELYISEQALSRALTSLENELGFKLLTRDRTGAMPTEAGELFLVRCKKAIEEFEILEKTAEEIKNGNDYEPLSLGFYEGFLGEEGAPFPVSLLHEFDIKHPEIEMGVIERPNNEVRDMLLERRIDLAVIAGEVPASCSSYTLKSLHLSVVVSKENPLSQKKAISWKDLDRQKIIHLSGEERMSRMVERASRRHGIDLRSLNIDASLSTSLSLVYEDVGILLLDAQDSWRADLSKVAFVDFAEADKPVCPQVSVAWLDDDNSSKSKLLFAEFVRNHFSKTARTAAS